MSGTIHTGATWRRRVMISDAYGPVDPTDVTAVLCPEARPTVTRLAAGDYELSMTEAETADLPAGQSHWELWGRVDTDLMVIATEYVTIIEVCGP